MFSNPFIIKYLPNALQSLIKLDNETKFKPFIISKDGPNNFGTIILKS